MEKYLVLALTICALFGYIYGMIRFFRRGTALYARMIVLGIGCAMMGRLFETLQLFIIGEIHSGFQIGVLGVVGSFLFLFTSNYGQMNSLVDDGSKSLRKYRLIACLAPLAVAGIYAFYYSRVGFCEIAVVHAVESAIIALAAFYHLKHLIIPDVENGLIDCIRPYNLLALIYAFLCMAEIVVSCMPVADVFMIILFVLLSLLMLTIVPVLERGVKKWTI